MMCDSTVSRRAPQLSWNKADTT